MKVLIAALVLLLLVLQYQLWVGDGGLPEVWKLEQELQKQQQENETLRERNLALEAEVLDLKKGLEAVEERARDDLGMIKQDEIFYQIIQDKKEEPDDDGE